MSKQFCVMTYGRTGSTALMRALACREDIGVPSKNIASDDEELFHPDKMSSYIDAYARLTERPIGSVNELIDRFYEHNREYAIAGFKSMPNRHLDFSRFVRRDDIHFISLSREDVASTVASFFVATQHKTWRESSRETRVTFSESDREQIEKLVAYVRNETQLLNSMPDAIRLTYEQLCDPQFSNPDLDDVFGQAVRLADPKPPTSGAHYVTNWDELCAYIESLIRTVRSTLVSDIQIAGAGIEDAPPVDRAALDFAQLTPSDRLRRRVPLLGANYVETQLLYPVARQEAKDMKEAFGQLKAYCTFIGHANSGHTVGGSLLDAHPHVVIAHELNAFRFLQAGFDAHQIYALLVKNSRTFAELGCQWGSYSYVVPNQHQGASTSIRVIGDKKGGGTSLIAGSDISLLELLDRTIPLEQNTFTSSETRLTTLHRLRRRRISRSNERCSTISVCAEPTNGLRMPSARKRSLSSITKNSSTIRASGSPNCAVSWAP